MEVSGPSGETPMLQAERQYNAGIIAAQSADSLPRVGVLIVSIVSPVTTGPGCFTYCTVQKSIADVQIQFLNLRRPVEIFYGFCAQFKIAHRFIL